MKSKITKTDSKNMLDHYETYAFDTILGKAVISKTWKDKFIISISTKTLCVGGKFDVIYFESSDEAYCKLVELCDAEVDRVLNYIKLGD